jgi:hypothetical protein
MTHHKRGPGKFRNGLRQAAVVGTVAAALTGVAVGSASASTTQVRSATALPVVATAHSAHGNGMTWNGMTWNWVRLFWSESRRRLSCGFGRGVMIERAPLPTFGVR